VDDAIAVPLVIVSIRMRRLREAASAGMFYLHRVAGQHVASLADLLLPSTELRVPSQRPANSGEPDRAG